MILTLTEVADHLGVSRDTVRRWCEQGRIQAIKKGRRWSVHLEDLNQFIAVYQGHGVTVQQSEDVVTEDGDSKVQNGSQPQDQKLSKVSS